MKRLVLLLIATGFILVSCQKEFDRKDDNTPIAEVNFDDLSIDPGFDWKLSHDIEFTIDAIDGLVKITSLDGNIVYHKGMNQDPSKAYNIAINIPDMVDNVLVNNTVYAIDGHTAQMLKSTVSLRPEELVQLINSEKKLLNSGTLSFGPDYTFNTNLYRFLDAATLDANRVVVAYTDASKKRYGTARIGTISGNTITWGPEKIFNKADTREIQVTSLGTGKFFIAYSDRGNSSYGTVIIGKSGTDVISFGTEQVFNNASTGYIACDMLDNSNIVVAYRDNGDGGRGDVTYGQISGAAISWKNNRIFESQKAQYIAIASLDATTFVIAYMQYGTSIRGLARIGYLSGSKIMLGKSKEFNAGTTGSTTVARISANKFAIAYNDVGNSNYGTSIVGTRAGSNITLGSEIVINSASTSYIEIKLFDTDKMLVVFTDQGSSSNGTAKVGDISGSSITWGTNKFVYNNGDSRLNALTVLNTVKFFAGFQDMSNNYGEGLIGTYAVAIPDADGDGVPDSEDDYPNDPDRAFDNYFPAAGFGSLAYEDLWPGKGDYDFNDVVVDYQFQTVTNASNKVVEIFGAFVSKASGAFLHNGFGFNLPDAATAFEGNPQKLSVSGYDIQEGHISLNNYGHESGQSKPTIIVFDDIFNLLTHPGSGTGANTEQDKPFVQFDTLVITMLPDDNFTQSDFSLSTWNPFIIIDQTRGHEVHLPDYEPTNLADQSIFGTWEDDSDPAIFRYYKSINNLPWAIDIPSAFEWPAEKKEITSAYLHFAEWAESSGQQYTDWYEDIAGYRDESKIYNVP